MPVHPVEKQKGILFGLIAGAFWGFSFLIPICLPETPSMEIAIGRFSWFGLVSLFALIAQNGFRKNSPFFKHWKKALLLSLCGYTLYYGILVAAIQRIGIPLSSLIVGLIPVTVSILSRDRIQNPRLFYVGLFAIVLGLMLLNREAFHLRVPTGIYLAFLCLALWSYFAYANGRFLQAHPEVRSAEWSSILGVYTGASTWAIAFLSHWFFSERRIRLDSLANVRFVLGTLFLGVFSTFFATRLWNRASALLPTGLVAQLIVSETIFALLYGFIYAQKLPDGLEWIAMFLGVAGVVMTIRAYQVFDEETSI